MAGRVVYPPLFCPVVLSGFAGSSALTINGATQTASFPALSITQTWNSSGVTFTGVRFNITNTASAAASLLLDVQEGGTTALNLRSGGAFTVRGASNQVLGSGTDGVRRWSIDPTGVKLVSASVVSWSSNANGPADTGTDVIVGRAAAATLQLGSDVNGAAVSQQLQAANGITGTDRTGGNFTLASGKGTGAGAASQVLIKTPSVLASGTTAQSLTTRVTIDSNGLQATGYLSSDGSAGVTAGPYTTITSITVKNGLITALSGS